MHLKNLTVLGFKSFAERTSLDFEPGITAIVGPNGCGKSNVADAIRWVLGEQSAKALRGGEMADVIFNGSDKRKAIAMAEVSLTITDVDEEQLRAAGVAIDFSELTLTRRVFRDGGSEYFINKTASRLRDIQQLFMGTGVGRTSYSIMAQGNITQVLSSKPEERRLIFEEAAGITKFKSQKKEALRKLDYTEQNLLRVEDLIKEVKRQIGSLQRQAGKARRFQKFQKDLRFLESQWVRHEYDALKLQMDAQKSRADRLRDEMQNRSESVLQSEDAVRQLRSAFTKLEGQINQSQQEGLSIKNQRDQNANRIGFHQQRLDELASQNDRAIAEIAQAEQRHFQTDQEIQSILIQSEKARFELQTRRRGVEESHLQMSAIEKSLNVLREELRSAQATAFSFVQALSKLRHEISSLELFKKANDHRLERLSTEKLQLEEERRNLHQSLGEFAKGMATKKQDASQKRTELNEHQTQLNEVQKHLRGLIHRLDSLLQKQAEGRSRLSVLRQLDASREGFSEGALTALRQSDRVIGSLADFIEVPDEYVFAIESALAHHLEIAMTQSETDAHQIIERLGELQKGRASVAALEMQNQKDPLQNQTEIHECFFKKGICAAAVVKCQSEAKGLVDSLLGFTILVSDLSEASRLWKESQGRFDFVTSTGEMLTRAGIFTGGKSGADPKATSVLGRKNEIRELAQMGQKLAISVDALSCEKDSLTKDQNVLVANLQKAQSELKAMEVAIATEEGEYVALTNSSAVLDQRVDALVFEIQSLADQSKETETKRGEMAAQKTTLEREVSESENKERALNHRLKSISQNREKAQEQLTERKVLLAKEQEALSSLERQRSPLERRKEELLQLRDQRRSELQSIVSKKDQSEMEIARGQQELEALAHQQECNRKKTSELLERKIAQETQMDEREKGLRALRHHLEEDQKKKNALDIDLAQMALKSENLCGRVDDKYQLRLQDIQGESFRLIKASDGQIRVETEGIEAGFDIDWDEVIQHVRTLQQRIEAMGPVNLVAIEEYEETEERFEFLNGQHEDLVKAKDELHEVLSRINTQTREMFASTFAQIRENFRNLFQEVFDGGNADLHLQDDGDVLEAGIEIVARPPGKRLQGVSLLSGGEQTMTAVALLFSIYQVRPSPFCVLDELDAPLDEANINRFLKVLQRFLEYSQFIIITHNKRTIGTADILYGVTMQERGVSKIVSVKFHRDEKKAEDSSQIPTQQALAESLERR